MRWTIVVIIAILSIPSIAHSSDMQAERAKLQQARAAAEAARESATKNFEATGGYQAALASVESKRISLELARASGTPQERINASSAWNKSRSDLQKMRSDFMASYAPLVDAEKSLAVAERRFEEAEAAFERSNFEAREMVARQAREQQERERQKPFSDRLTRLTEILELMKSVPSAQEAKDPYLSYTRKSELVASAIRTTESYLRRENADSKHFNSLCEPCVKICAMWETSLTSREREYPSAMILAVEIQKIPRIAACYLIEEQVDISSKTRLPAKTADESEVQVRELDQLVAMGKRRYDYDDVMLSHVDEACHLLRAREGTTPVLPDHPK